MTEFRRNFYENRALRPRVARAYRGRSRAFHTAPVTRKGYVTKRAYYPLNDFAMQIVREIADLTRQTGGLSAGDFYSDIEDVLNTYMTRGRAKRVQEEIGAPLADRDEWFYDDMTDLRLISVREYLLDAGIEGMIQRGEV